MYWIISYWGKILLTETEPRIESGLLRFNSNAWEAKQTASGLVKEKSEVKYIGTNIIDYIKKVDGDINNDYK